MKRTIATLAVCCMLSAASLQAHATEYEYQTIPGGAIWNSCEGNRNSAITWAKRSAKNQANDDCRDLGTGWRFDRVVQEGYEQAIPCRDGRTFKGEITKASYSCKRLLK